MLDVALIPLLDKLTENLALNPKEREKFDIILYRLDGIMYHRCADHLLVRALAIDADYLNDRWAAIEKTKTPESQTHYYETLRHIQRACEEIGFTNTIIYRNCVKAHTPCPWE